MLRSLPTVAECTRALPLLCVGLLACHQPDGWLLSYRLERSLPLADRFLEETAHDLGTGAAREKLLSGWSRNETNREGETFVWSNGPRSSIGFLRFQPDSATLHLRGLAFDAPDAPAQVVEVSVNGTPLSKAPIEATWTDVELEVPAELQQVGWNVVTLDYAWTRSALPSQRDQRWPRRQRDLAVAWSSAALDEPTDAGQAVARASLVQETLFLGAGTSLFYEVEFLAPSRIRVESIDFERVAANPAQDGNAPQLVPAVEVYLGAKERAGLMRVGALTTDTLSLEFPAAGTEAANRETKVVVLRASTAANLHSPILERRAEDS